MKGGKILMLGVALLVAGCWLIGPVWSSTMIPPNGSLPGHGPADWRRAIGSDAVVRSGSGITPPTDP